MPDQSSPSPTRKVIAGAIAGSSATIIVWVLNATVFVKSPMPAEVAAAFTTVLSGLAAYFTSPSDRDLVGKPPDAP
jgi:hypothetical protein